MLTLSQIRENTTEVIENLKKKNFDGQEIISNILDIDKKRRNLQFELDSKQSELNNLSREIGELFKTGKKEEAQTIKQKTVKLKEEIKVLGEKFDQTETELQNLLIQVPNLPHHSVPPGKGSADNVIVKSGGEIPRLHKNAMPHWDLGKKYEILDFDLGTKLTGAGFPLFKGKGAKLQRALISFFLDENVKAGYTEFLPPLMVNEDSGFGTGQLPDKEGQMYHITLDNYYLIPTAEVPVTNIYRDIILNANDFPIKNTAYTPCFRREAGSYGKDVRGLNRVHQFDKVEIDQIQHPEN